MYSRYEIVVLAIIVVIKNIILSQIARSPNLHTQLPPFSTQPASCLMAWMPSALINRHHATTSKGHNKQHIGPMSKNM